MQRVFLLSLLLVLFGGAVWAQEFTSSSKKAIKRFEKGRELFLARQYAQAVVAINGALSIDPNFVEAHLVHAEIQLDLGNVKGAIDAYRKVVAINPSFYPLCLFNLGYLEVSTGDYKNARGHFQQFLSSPRVSERYRERAEHNIAVCDFAKLAMEHPVPFEPKNLGPNVNSAYDEYFPAITADNDVLLYTRRIKDDQNEFGEQEDFYVSEKRDGKWSKCYNMGAPINTHYNEGSPTISPDGKIIIFSACEERYGYGPNRKGYGKCDIFFVKKVGDKWSMPMNMGPPISTAAWDVQPSYSSDGKTLYFVSQRKGSLGDADIWMSQLTDEGVWGQVQNLGPVINTKGKEEAVFIHPDNQTLYFASNGHVGMGGLDIFVSKRQEDGSWGKPKNLGYPINTFNDENGLIVSAGGGTAYFSSNREGGEGGLDMYQFPLHEGVRPIKVTYMKGRVYDSKTKKSLSARFELIDLETGDVVVESSSDRVTGEFLVCLPTNKNYALNVSKKRYLFFSENFSLMKAGTSSEPYLMDVPLQLIQINRMAILKNIFYESGSFALKESSFIELKKLIDFLIENETVHIEIEGHTDNVGDLKSNQILSENRAKSVYSYLIEHGIDKERLGYIGYGETQPIRLNTNEADRAKNRRTVFKVVSMGE